MRSLYGFQDETVNPWYKNYYELADKAGLITGETIDTVDGINITRQKLGTWFYQAAHSDTDITTDTETDTDTTTDTTIDTDTNTTTDTTTDTDTVSDTDTVDDTDNAQGPFQLTHEEIVYSSRFLLIE
jgi:Tfp pilus assembly major pilin PilA